MFFLSALSCSGPESESADRPSSIDDLKNVSIGCISGSLVETYVLDKMPDCKSVALPSETDMLASLCSGKCDYALIDKALQYAVDFEQMGLDVLFEVDELGGNYAFGTSYSDRELCDSLNSFISIIQKNGVMSEMFDRWFSPDNRNSVMPEIKVHDEGDVLEIASFNTIFPFCFMSSQGFSGFEPELLLRFADYLGRPVHFTGYDFNALLATLPSGKADIINGSIFITEERSKKILFSAPYSYSATVCIAKTGSASQKLSPGEWVRQGIQDNLMAENRWRMILDGLWLTVVISILSILLGTLIGVLICWMRTSRIPVFRGFAKVYLDVLRGIPMLVFLMIMFYIVFSSSGVTATTVAVVAFAMNFGAFTSEIFRTGLSSVDKGQREAGIALGFTNVQTFFYIVLPQALKKIIPVFKNEAVSLVKNTSIVGYIAIQDLTKVSDIIRSRTFDAFFPLIVISVLYFALAWLLGKLLDIMNKN